ncbi:MAG: phospholipase, partial [Caldimonas sp.]
MRGRRAAVPLPVDAATPLPPLLVIQGSADRIVAAANGNEVAQLWADREGAKPRRSRIVKRGNRRAATITDYRVRSRGVATLCVIEGLGHAWSGGAAGHAYSDPEGPDASRMIWSFVTRQFARTAAGNAQAAPPAEKVFS